MNSPSELKKDKTELNLVKSKDRNVLWERRPSI